MSRAAALRWWRNLTDAEKNELVTKYKPEWTTIMVSMSTSEIERIFLLCSFSAKNGEI